MRPLLPPAFVVPEIRARFETTILAGLYRAGYQKVSVGPAKQRYGVLSSSEGNGNATVARHRHAAVVRSPY